MRATWAWIAAGVAATTWAATLAGAQQPPEEAEAGRLSLQPDYQSVYAPVMPPAPDTGVNEGAAHLSIEVRYYTDYVFRGIDYTQVGGSQDSPNLQFDGTLWLDLGRLPSPFVGVFTNVYNSDPDSRFQEIRPTFGIFWDLHPLHLTLGNNTYIYPDREFSNTGEAFFRLQVDDSYFFRTEQPIFSPYVMVAYDYDRLEGWYMEAGLEHTLRIPDTGLELTFLGRVGYVDGIREQFVFTGTRDNGFRFYEVGLIGSYSLNTLFNVSRRYGEWSFKGYLFYTDELQDGLMGSTELWGGAGIGFKY